MLFRFLQCSFSCISLYLQIVHVQFLCISCMSFSDRKVSANHIAAGLISPLEVSMRNQRLDCAGIRQLIAGDAESVLCTRVSRWDAYGRKRYAENSDHKCAWLNDISRQRWWESKEGLSKNKIVQKCVFCVWNQSDEGGELSKNILSTMIK